MFISADKLSAPMVGDPSASGAELLFIRVIEQAVEDHRRPTWRDDVDAFFRGPTFARYCTLLGWNDRWARSRIERFVTTGARLASGDGSAIGAA